MKVISFIKLLVLYNGSSNPAYIIIQIFIGDGHRLGSPRSRWWGKNFLGGSLLESCPGISTYREWKEGGLGGGRQACVLSHVQLFVTPRTIAHQAPLPMGFTRQKYWSGLPFSPAEGLPEPETKHASPVVSCIAGGFFITWVTREITWREKWECNSDTKSPQLMTGGALKLS